ncbi:hypothetical protein [Parasphingopyxis marina]|uniref:Uncharacterized protein n=1 Tax=Parasphingopyxis marina TaxID=2761622 RepID=A0A842I019_9SPHN|nr:hypothetical protein [Parasphingopyxis marina]MBC2777104.1 hypothetical protein [Parasphingopyxis marina]
MHSPRSFKAEKPVSLHKVARFHRIDGEIFDVRMTSGCEIFVGRFTRLPDLDHRDGIISFSEPALF